VAAAGWRRHAEADLRLRNGELIEGSTVDIPAAEAVAEVAGVRLAGTASAHGELKAGSPSQAQLAVRLPRFTARPSDAKDVRLFDGRDLALDLTGDGRLQELRKGVRAQLRFSEATIPDLTAYNRYLGSPQVRLLRGTGTVSGDATLDTDGRVGHGTARLLGRNASAKVAGLDMGGDIDVNATLRRGDFNQRHFDLSGTTVELRNVQVAGTGLDGMERPRGLQAWAASMRSRRSRWTPPPTWISAMRDRCWRCSQSAPTTRAGPCPCWIPARWMHRRRCAGARAIWSSTACRPRTIACRCARGWICWNSASAAISICAGGCWARASSWMATSASGIWPRRASGLISSLPCCQQPGGRRGSSD
jgi:hypothetical protein